MKWAALVTLNRLRDRRDLAVRVLDYTDDGGAEVTLLDLTRPLRLDDSPVRVTILPTGELECPGCEERAA